jgi:U6 snRNA-associated Sm-like protein LSm8
MAGFDQRSNIVLSDCKERVFSMDEGVEEIALGLYLVKGDMMYAISTSYSDRIDALFFVSSTAVSLVN